MARVLVTGASGFVGRHLLPALVAAGFDVVAKKEPVLHETYQLNRADTRGEVSFVTDVFELSGRTSNVEVKTYSPVNNHWIYVNYALINHETFASMNAARL